MSTENIVWRLAQLASLPFQERYVINGNADEYAIDTELIENVDGLKYIISKSEYRKSLTIDQLAALEELFECIDKNSGEALSAKSREEGVLLIREGAAWKALRENSKRALNAFGINVDSLSAEEIAKLAD